MAAVEGNDFMKCFPKTYGVVKTKHGTHTRNYKRDIRGGMNHMEASWKATYDSNTFIFNELFGSKDNGL